MSHPSTTQAPGKAASPRTASGAARTRLAAAGAPGTFELKACPHPLIEHVYSTRRIPVGGGESVPMDVYIPREEGNYLYSLVRHLRPEVTIEVGMANGLSTLFIAKGLQDNGAGRHIAIDPFQRSEWRSAGLGLVRQAGLGARVELRESFSHQALPDLEREGVRAQLAFIDGAHLFDHAISDFLCIDRMLDTGGLIAFDDADWPAIRQAIRFILANRAYEVAFRDVIIEERRPTPTAAAQVIRAVTRVAPKLGTKFRPDFLTPDDEIGVRGRCVVLRKLREDDRDSQSRCHRAF